MKLVEPTSEITNGIQVRIGVAVDTGISLEDGLESKKIQLLASKSPKFKQVFPSSKQDKTS